MKKVMALTGIRSEYYMQRSILHAIDSHPDLELFLVVSGAHLSPEYGLTIDEVTNDGFTVNERVESLISSNRDAARLQGAALQLSHLTHIADRERPDWLLAPTDREEAMVMALAGAYLNLATAHYSAGDRVVGNVDDMVRHAVSRLSHIMLCTSEDSRARLIRAGEEEWRVHNVGHAGLDRLRDTPPLSDAELADRMGVDAIKRPYLMVIQHPISSEIDQAGEQMAHTLEAVKSLGLQTFISQPNSDAGSRDMIDRIKAADQSGLVHAFSNIPDLEFVNLLRGASALVGNSSMGLLEAPFLKLPVVNVGRRQTARHHAANVLFTGHETEEIVRTVKIVLEDEETKARIKACENPFGDGRTGKRVADFLAATPIDHRLMNKDIAY